MIVIPALLQPCCGIPHKYVQQSESLSMGLLTFSGVFVCLFWKPESHSLYLKGIFYKMKLKLWYYAIVNVLESLGLIMQYLIFFIFIQWSSKAE